MTSASDQPSSAEGRTVLIAHPSPDLYGADLQLLQTVAALVGARWQVLVVLPSTGPLVPRLEEVGARVELVPFPVLRKADLRPAGLLRLVGSAVAACVRGVRLVRRLRPAALLTNTVTLPWWLLVARLTRTPALCHLHEAETEPHLIVRRLVTAPLALADRVLVISQSAYSAMVEAQPRLAGRAQIIYNGVPEPEHEPGPAQRHRPFQLVTVGRLSPRKAADLTLETAALLRREGLEVEVTLAGTSFTGYEAYETSLRERAEQPDLVGAVTFAGYQSPIWPTLEASDIVVAPSLNEPFGNAVVEAQLARRPLVATASQGHLESIIDEQTGLLVPARDVAAMAAAVRRLIEDQELADRLTDQAQREARSRFSVARYREEIADAVGRAADRRP